MCNIKRQKMATQPVKGIIRQVKPLLSVNPLEARRRVLNLYKLWYRELPAIILIHDLPLNLSQASEKLRGEFMKHKNLTDIRAIDMLVVKGHMEFKEVISKHKQGCHVMYMFKDTQIPQPKSFMAKFLSGVD